jgi:hypothetical protein
VAINLEYGLINLVKERKISNEKKKEWYFGESVQFDNNQKTFKNIEG